MDKEQQLKEAWNKIVDALNKAGECQITTVIEPLPKNMRPIERESLEILKKQILELELLIDGHDCQFSRDDGCDCNRYRAELTRLYKIMQSAIDKLSLACCSDASDLIDLDGFSDDTPYGGSIDQHDIAKENEIIF